jgi:hypothetical protein
LCSSHRAGTRSCGWPRIRPPLPGHVGSGLDHCIMSLPHAPPHQRVAGSQTGQGQPRISRSSWRSRACRRQQARGMRRRQEDLSQAGPRENRGEAGVLATQRSAQHSASVWRPNASLIPKARADGRGLPSYISWCRPPPASEVGLNPGRIPPAVVSSATRFTADIPSSHGKRWRSPHR